MSLYYQPSNKMPLGGMLLFLLGGVALAAGLAFVYIYAVWYIPFIYINFFLCLGFGLVLGVGLTMLVRAGKLRSPKGTLALAALVGLAAVYLEWGIYLTLLFNSETTGSDTGTSFSTSLFASIIANPNDMWTAMRKINETGTWSIKSSTPTGLFLWLIWVIEAVIIVGATAILGSTQADEPFSESANEWADEETLAHPVGYSHDKAATRQALETGQFHGLTPHLTDTELGEFAQVKLHRAPNDPACHYLTLENITKSLNSKGKAEQTTTKVVQHLAISHAAYQDLKARFGTAPGGAA